MTGDASTGGLQHLYTRRDVLRGGGLLAAGLASAQYVLLERAVAAIPDMVQQGQGPGGAPSHVVTLRRRDDLLHLRFECWNLVVVDQGGGKRLVRKNPGTAYLVVVFPPQSLGERAWAKGEDLTALPVPSWPAGESRLAFEVPAAVTSIDYTLEGLLSWTALHPRLVPVAKGSPDPVPPGQEAAGPVHPQIRAPHRSETSLEIPWRLHLSPHPGLGWAHAMAPVTHNGRTEIWHTRLGVRDGDTVDEWTAAGRTVQAIWAPAWQPVSDGQNWQSADEPEVALKQGPRSAIVKATSDYALEGRAPIDVHRLMLTPLGGWLDVHGTWDIDWDTDDVNLTEWRHQATMGRDHYVRVVEKGRLFPYGHRAVWVTETERQFEELFGAVGGLLRTRTYVVVLEPERSYPGLGQPHDGRAWPFRRLGFTTLATPDLSQPAAGKIIEVENAPFLFEVWAEDLEGHRVDFSTPVIFLGESDAFASQPVGEAAANWAASGELRTRDLSGQKVTLAQPSEPEDTTLDVSTVTVGAETDTEASGAQLGEASQPPFYPGVEELTARVGALDQISGDGGAPAAAYRFPRRYLVSAFEATDNQDTTNHGQVFLEALGTVQPVAVPQDRAGGLIDPSFAVGGLSRALGPVGEDLTKIARGEFDPETFFSQLSLPKLLGAIDLFKIVEKATDFVAKPTEALTIKAHPVGPGPDAVRSELHWEPNLDTDGKLIDPEPQSTLRISAVFQQSLQSAADSFYEFDGFLGPFTLNLVGGGDFQIIEVLFDYVHFHARSGEKPTLKPKLAGVGFKGALQFVEVLQDFLDFNGAKPGLVFTREYAELDLGFKLPSIPLGQVWLNNIGFGATLTIPFNGQPARFGFRFSEPDDPFNVTYCCLGGGGFMGIRFDLEGFERLELAIEAGAYLPLDFVVASGSLSVALGAFMFIEEEDTVVKLGLTAYLRFSGGLQVLGLIGVSVQLYLGLGFELVGELEFQIPKLVGEGEFILEVKALIFNPEIKIHIRREIGSTPKEFEELFSEADWQSYAGAFA